MRFPVGVCSRSVRNEFSKFCSVRVSFSKVCRIRFGFSENQRFDLDFVAIATDLINYILPIIFKLLLSTYVIIRLAMHVKSKTRPVEIENLGGQVRFGFLKTVSDSFLLVSAHPYFAGMPSQSCQTVWYRLRAKTDKLLSK